MESSQNSHHKHSVEEEHAIERRKLERKVSSQEAEDMGESLPTGFRGEGFDNGKPEQDKKIKK